MKSADFFEASKHPTLSFVSTKFEKLSEENFLLQGDLNFLSITKNITLNVEYGGVIKDPWGYMRTGLTVEGK